MRNVFLSLALLACSTAAAADRTAQWNQVNEAAREGLPRTAIERLEPILKAAMDERAYAEATKALAFKITYEAAVQGQKPEEKILRLQPAIPTAPAEMKPMLETVLAHWYWQYFQQNRWRFVRRTATAEAVTNDFTTWDLPRLFAEIDKHFSAALASPADLKRVPVSAWDALLEKGTMPDTYRPTLYDFIAHEALRFYQSGEQAGAQAEEVFEIEADSPVFAAVDQFLAWRVPAPPAGQRSPKHAAILLYQDLLRFHRGDEDQTAFAAADLERLRFGNNAALGEEKEARYKTALTTFIDRWADNEISTQALHDLATVYQHDNEMLKAHELATRGAKIHPASVGAKLCRNLLVTIEQRSASITTERVWNEPWPKIDVQYRNVTNLYLRAVAANWDEFLDRRRSRPENLNDAERRALLARAPAAEFSFQLPATPDYLQRTEQIEAPKLGPGFYFLIASHDRSFSEEDNPVTFTTVWVSDLALVVRAREGQVQGFVLEALSGEPIDGADVEAWHLSQNGSRVASEPMKSDTNGFFSFAAVQRPYLVRARHNGQQLASLHDLYGHRTEPDRLPGHGQTIFFTDRALYRPGQTVQYKGICVFSDQNANTYEVLSGKQVTVVFMDPNGNQVARQSHRCNDYGSFSGSFTAPRDRVMGRMTIHAEGDVPGAAQISVEEYKRPKFQVTVAPPVTAAKLSETVSITAKAESYTGAAIDGAGVRWRVVREVRWPIWWGWFSRHPQVTPSREIAHGSARTAADGSIKIEFTAQPDRTIAPTNEPVFVYTIHVDVTDGAGETRSGERQVRVGYTALQAALTAESWQTDDNPFPLKVSTTTLDDEPQTAEGALKIYRLQQPAKVQRAPLPELYARFRQGNSHDEKAAMSSWPLGEIIREIGFTTDDAGQFSTAVQLAAGAYRVVAETQDRFGKRVTALLPIVVLSPNEEKLGLKVPHLFEAPKWSVEPGQEFMAVWGSGYDSARAFIEIEHRHKLLERYWTTPGRTQQQIKRAIDESLRGGFTVHVTQVRENRAYLESRKVEVPWSNKDLDLKWEHFTSKLEPGQKETWTAVISGPKSQKTVAEMVATLYDASLDAYLDHSWPQRLQAFYQDHSSMRPQFENSEMIFQHLRGGWRINHESVDIRYRTLPSELVSPANRYFLRARGASSLATAAAPAPSAVPAMEMTTRMADVAMKQESMAGVAAQDFAAAGAAGPVKSPDLSQVSARKNLNETAFFFPQLISESNGSVRVEFTMPEALTKWRVMAFAHDRVLRSGYVEATAVTAKDLMVQPNPPRFVREGDIIEFTVKISNQSAARQQGTVRLTFNEAATEQSADAALDNKKTEQSFDIASKESRSFSWRIKVPDGLGFLTYKAVASSGRVSDGEEGYLPVLSRGVFVTESIPLPIRGPATKKFEFAKLLKSGGSDTLRHQSLTVQMVSNPSWYAVLALPYLMEFPHECTEQTFNRFYANALARHISRSDPKIERIFEQWRNTPALESPLEKNQDLKSVMVEETPWLRQARNESQARRNVGILFDSNRLESETQRLIRQLGEAQLGDGAWPWFPGGRGNDYITLYIVSGFGRLRHLGADIQVEPAVRALNRLDTWINERYREILKHGDKNDNHLSSTVALYLYARSFFLKDQPIAAPNKEAVDYFLEQARKYWLQLGLRQSQGHLALALTRFGDKPAAMRIMRSLKERSVTDDELGRFWRDTELSWWWYHAPIETQALMIEAFDEVAGDASAVEECKAWLLKQKQTQDWKTTKATADAVYALLLRGGNWLASDALVEVQLGGATVRPGSGTTRRTDAPAKPVEAGTGFYEVRYQPGNIKPKLGEITVKKRDPGIAWGSVHWQYMEDVSKVTAHTGTPLKLAKSLYRKANTPSGPVIEAVKGPVAVGDELVVRIELRVDRDMEYIHMKDQRGSGTEPVNVLSRYKFQDGLAYYESTRDTATHFFIDYLPKGTYVFEYSTRVQHRGQYQSGLTEIQCMYAPEFNSHSASVPITVN